VKIAFSPVKQTPIPARAGTYRFTGQFCSKRWRLSFAKLGQPPTRPRTPAFIEGPARPGYTKKFRRNHLYCRYLAGRPIIRLRLLASRYGLLLPGQARRGSPVPPKELLHMPGSSLRPRRAVQTFGLTRPSMLLPPSQRRRRAWRRQFNVIRKTCPCPVVLWAKTSALADAGSCNRCSAHNRHPADRRLGHRSRLKHRFQRQIPPLPIRHDAQSLASH
jgi:hypothetical protein